MGPALIQRGASRFARSATSKSARTAHIVRVETPLRSSNSPPLVATRSCMQPSLFPAPPTPPPATPSRSRFITLLGWFVLIGSAIITPISLITLLMIVAGSHGTANANMLDAFFMVCLPPATLIAGIGLLRRWRWPRIYTQVLALTFALWNAGILWRGPTPERTYTSASGVPTTVLASQVDYPQRLASFAISLGIFFALMAKSVRQEFVASIRSQDTRNAFTPPDLPVSPTMNTRLSTANFASAPVGQTAQSDSSPRDLPLTSPALNTRAFSAGVFSQQQRSQHRALLLAIVIMSAIAVGTGWLVHRGLSLGETYLPTKRATHSREVLRGTEPVLFWVSTGLYAALSVGSIGLALWGTREALRRPHLRTRSETRF